MILFQNSRCNMISQKPWVQMHPLNPPLRCPCTLDEYLLLFSDVPMVVEYTIHVRPLAKLEVLGLKTELTAGSDPVPFGVAGYDAEENEFDTLDGLQLTW